MKRYYYLAASLPDLGLELKLPVTFSDFLLDADVYLSKTHKKLTGVLRELIDIENIRRLLLEQKIDDRGNLSEAELDEAILSKVNLPEYAVDFLDQFNTIQSRLDHFAALYAGFYQAHQKTGNLFIDKYLQLEHELRLWLSLLRAKRMGIDFSYVLQFEDTQDPLIMSMLIQNQNSDLLIPTEYKALKDFFVNFADDPLLLHKKIEEFRIQKITELTQDNFFEVDNILAFLAKLLVIEQWQSLDLDVGFNRLTRFSKSN
jgi:hypothetical protein